jgi:hypothetical protein
MTSHLHLRIIDNPLVENKSWRTATLKRMVEVLVETQTFAIERDAIRCLHHTGFRAVDIIMCIDDARQAANTQAVVAGEMVKP